MKLFILYSQTGEPFKQRLEVYLTILKKQGLIDIWLDRQINPGKEWDRKSITGLESSDMGLMLVNSQLLEHMEDNPAKWSYILQLVQTNQWKVIPVILEECGWQDRFKEHFSMVFPKNRKAIDNKEAWSNREEAFVSIFNELKTIIRRDGDSIKAANSVKSKRKYHFSNENFPWEQLVKEIEERRVIPIIGPGLKYVVRGNPPMQNQGLLYHFLADEVLNECGVSLDSNETNRFNKACAEYLNKNENKYYRLTALLNEKLKNIRVPHNSALEKLARIKGFNFFIDTAYDDLLFHTIKTYRSIDATQLSFTASQKDLGNMDTRLYYRMEEAYQAAVVYHILGNLFNREPALSGPDITRNLLHFLENKQSQHHNKIYSFLEGKSLLFIGCSFEDSIYYFFLLYILNHLMSEGHTKSTMSYYIVDRSTGEKYPLKGLPGVSSKYEIELFDSSIGGTDFVDLLFEKINAISPGNIVQPLEYPPIGAIGFVSSDRDAAGNLADNLKSDDINVWFDDKELKGGDRVDDEIVRVIDNCRVFIPIISKNSLQTVNEPGKENYHIKEWEWACKERDKKNTPSIIPVIIDDTKWIYNGFKDFFHLNIPGGEKTGDYEMLINQLKMIREELYGIEVESALLKNKAPGSTIGIKNPFKLLDSYGENDSQFFRGREAEKDELFRLVKFNLLTIVLGKSGIGKTSLLNAGLFPQLRENHFIPIRIRLNYSNDAPSLIEQIHTLIKQDLEKQRIGIESRSNSSGAGYIREKETLWEYFKRAKHFYTGEKQTEITPVLVFDQFEELFTIGKNHPDKDVLIDELYWLIENQFPPTFDKNDPFFSSMGPDVRVIFSLREDYLPDLVQLKARIPSLDRILFRVSPLNGSQAREVIRTGFEEEKVDDILKCFYPTGTAENKTIPDDKLEVEPALLSLLCYQFFEKFEKKELKSISKKEQNKILENFYDSEMKKSSDKIEKFIEKNLLASGGFRKPAPLEQTDPLKKDIERLIDRRILRKIYLEETEYIEIIHDVLAPIIAEKRSRRMKKVRNWITVSSISLSLIFLVLMIWAFYLKHQTDVQNKKVIELNVAAESLLTLPRDNTQAIQIAGDAFRMGLPVPQPRTYQALCAAGYSSLEDPFYITSVKHEQAVSWTAFSKDRQTFLTASDDKTARLWNIRGGLINKFDHRNRVNSAIFSPDGKQVLTASDDKTAILWSIEGKKLAVFKHYAGVVSALFSSDGKLVLTASRDNTAKLWDAKADKNPRPKQQFKHSAAVVSAVFSPDGRKILTASWDRRAILWNLDGTQIQVFNPGTALSSASFSPDGTKILTVASSDRGAALWEIGGKLLKEFNMDEPVISGLFSPDGQTILTVSNSNIVKLWSLEGQQVAELRGHTDKITMARFSPDGQTIITASRDKTVKVWDLDGMLLWDIRKFDGFVNSAVFSPDSRRFITGCEDGTATVWTLETHLLVNLGKHKSQVNTALFSPDGKRVLTSSNDYSAKVWDLTGEVKFNLVRHMGFLSSAVFSPDGKQVLTASMDYKARLWNLEGESESEPVVFPHQGPVSSAVFSRDGRQILTISDDGYARLWDLQGNLKYKLQNTKRVFIYGQFSPDGRQVLLTSDDRTAKLWTPEENKEMNLDAQSVFRAIFSPGGRQIFVVSWDKTARFFDLTGKNLDRFPLDGVPTSVVFSPDGESILLGFDDGAARRIDLEGKVLTTVRHEAAVTCAVFSRDGKRMLTASKDRTAKLWDLDGNLLADLNKHTDVVYTAAFSPDGKRMVTASKDGTAKIWYTPELIMEWLEKK